MSKYGPEPEDLAELAEIARKAHAAGRPMSDAVAAAYGMTRRYATSKISRARRQGHDIPLDLPTKLQPGEQGAVRRATFNGTGTITRAEYMAMTANSDRPLTESGLVRYHQSDTMRVIGGWR